jgi:hypothetical protein
MPAGQGSSTPGTRKGWNKALASWVWKNWLQPGPPAALPCRCAVVPSAHWCPRPLAFSPLRLPQKCLVKHKDIRKFLDGIYLSERGTLVKAE